jgi:hypothetical protein
MALTVGDVLPFSATVRDANGALADATTMTLTVTKPDGTPATGSPFTVTSSPAGVYDRNVASTLAGQYVGYWLATGTNAGSHVQVFDVRPITAGIVSLDDVKKHINNPTLTTAHDDELEIYIEAAAVWLNGRLGTSVVRGIITDERQYGGGGTVILRNTPVASITTVTPIAVGGSVVTVADLDIDPAGYITYKNGTSTFPSGLYLWTYVAGPQVVDARVSLAAREIVKGLWESQRGASGLPMQSEIEEIPGMSSTWSRVNTLIGDLRMPGVA